MIDSYQTIQCPTEGVYKEKGSKFISYAYPVNSEKEVKFILERIKKEHFSARHICYAFMLGADKALYRAYDAAEPANTAGKPILNQINSFKLTNILVIVVRYFGGTLLGTNGLIQAYKASAHEALSKALIITKFEEIQMEIIFDYEKTGEVMRVIKSHHLDIIRQEHLNDKAKIYLKIKKSEMTKISSQINLIQKVKLLFH
jgi:uncharacterized YigZ family protein